MLILETIQYSIAVFVVNSVDHFKSLVLGRSIKVEVLMIIVIGR